jgi:hypothetical protein
VRKREREREGEGSWGFFFFGVCVLLARHVSILLS